MLEAAYGFEVSSSGKAPGAFWLCDDHAVPAALFAKSDSAPVVVPWLLFESTRGSALFVRSEMRGPVAVGAGPLEVVSVSRVSSCSAAP